MTAKELGDRLAFPALGSDGVLFTGMTLRQYYAGVAMQGLLANPGFKDSAIRFAPPDGDIKTVYSRQATVAADALLEELAKP